MKTLLDFAEELARNYDARRPEPDGRKYSGGKTITKSFVFPKDMRRAARHINPPIDADDGNE